MYVKNSYTCSAIQRPKHLENNRMIYDVKINFPIVNRLLQFLNNVNDFVYLWQKFYQNSTKWRHIEIGKWSIIFDSFRTFIGSSDT